MECVYLDSDTVTKIKQRQKENFEVFLFLLDFQPEIQIKEFEIGMALFLYLKVIQRGEKK